jgi:hypothetical protein
MKSGNNFIAFILIGMFFIPAVAADFSVGNASHSITTSYGAGDTILGWVNMSFDDESGDSELETNFGDSIKLKELLDLNNINYDCVPEDCQSLYSGNNSAVIKSVSLDEDEKAIFGAKLNGNGVSVKTFSINLSSNSPASCTNQLKIDILDDGIIDIGNSKAILTPGVFCGSQDYACFNPGNAVQQADLSGSRYCQIISVGETPAIYAGAWIKKGTTNVSRIFMELRNKDGSGITGSPSCDLNLVAITTNGGEVACDIQYSIIKSGEYAICVGFSESSDYKIAFNTQPPANACGFRSSGTPNAAYHIFARERQYAAVGSFVINESTSNNLILNINNYLNSKYKRDCPLEGCIVPISFEAEESQQITLSGLAFSYDTSGPSGISDNAIYEVFKSSPKITLPDFKKIDIGSANFKVPQNFGNFNLSLELDGERVFDKTAFSVKDVPRILALFPKATALTYPTKFIVAVSVPQSNVTNATNNSIVSYDWDFGDNKKEITTTPFVTHTYNNTGNFSIKITIKDKIGVSSTSIFSVQVGSAKNITDATLNSETSKLNKLKSQVQSYPIWYSSEIDEKLDLANAESILKRLTTSYSTASAENEYIKILDELLDLNLPSSINVSSKASGIKFFPSEQNVNIDALGNEGGFGSYDSAEESAYKQSIIGWGVQNLDVSLDFTEYAANRDGELDPILSVYDMTFNKKGFVSNDVYVIFNDLENLKFAADYDEKFRESYNFIILDKIELETPQKISFSTTTNNEIDVPVFYAPPLSYVSIGPTEIVSLCDDDGVCGDDETWRTCGDCKPWGAILLFLVIFLLISMIAYVILYIWYQKNYKKYLFKSEVQLYNLKAYIHKEKQKGVSNAELRERLRKAGWTGEQIDYALSRYEGKYTGLMKIEIVRNFIEKDSKAHNNKQ